MWLVLTIIYKSFAREKFRLLFSWHRLRLRKGKLLKYFFFTCTLQNCLLKAFACVGQGITARVDREDQPMKIPKKNNERQRKHDRTYYNRGGIEHRKEWRKWPHKEVKIKTCLCHVHSFVRSCSVYLCICFLIKCLISARLYMQQKCFCVFREWRPESVPRLSAVSLNARWSCSWGRWASVSPFLCAVSNPMNSKSPWWVRLGFSVFDT